MISRLKLMDFRCYGSFSWQIPQQGAIILGNNARGKTSLLEAVCFLLRLQSPRTARTGPLVSHGKQSFGIRGELPGHPVGAGRSGPPRQRRAPQRPAQLPGGQLSRGMDGE